VLGFVKTSRESECSISITFDVDVALAPGLANSGEADERSSRLPFGPYDRKDRHKRERCLRSASTGQAWYGPASNQYYFARSTAGLLGVENAGPPPTAVSPDTKTAVGSHSVAADPNQKRVFVPIRSSTFGPATICGSKGGTETSGCVAVYESP
jgi:hypothetical protein